MDAAGFDVIVLETVGAGQSEVEIAGIADIKVVVSAPGLGDDVQAIKAGILEIADILLVNKGDHPLMLQTVRHLKTMANMQACRASSAGTEDRCDLTGEGMEALVEAVDRLGKSRRIGAPVTRSRRLIRRAALDLMAGVWTHGRGHAG